MVGAASVLERARPLRRSEFDRMVEVGLFADERVELLGGMIVAMSPQSAPHASVIQALNKLFLLALARSGAGIDVRVQSPLAVSDDSQPEPDLALVPEGRYRSAHPSRALLVVEVADSSARLDRGFKAELYATADVREYWLVDLAAAVVEVHTEIVNGIYTRVTPYRAGEAIEPACIPGARFPVSEIL